MELSCEIFQQNNLGLFDVIDKFEKKFKEIKVEGNRKNVAGVLYLEYDCLSETYYTDSELKTMYMCIESKAWRDSRDKGLIKEDNPMIDDQDL